MGKQVEQFATLRCNICARIGRERRPTPCCEYSIGSSHAVVHPEAPPRLKEVTTACCGSGKFDGKSGCTPNATLCDSRHKYLFWDLLHATSKLAAAAIYNGSPHLAAPINFRQLAEDQC
ncbi:GDSL esterase/lipase At4g28780-like [Triticum dicoccoides]|uniref:GDSL esterase/lipase At4g28780-like n=1 Tax=Triticum dicoccoides TaxID=85692 RepID=UPI0018919C6A|nr:GDSL esterase/lipase At4g28780-like [Triticum dicoccoides]